MNNTDVILLPGERVDDLQLNGLRIIQNPSLFRFGADAVCLANFAKAKKRETALDLGTGSGVIPILMSAKTEARFFTGLEIHPETAGMARRSVLLNGLEGRIRIDTGDIKTAPALYGTGAFDWVTVNPPYIPRSADEKLNANAALTIARHEIYCRLSDIVSSSALLLKPGGRLYIVHRADRLADVFEALRANNLEPKILQLVQHGEKKPSLILAEAALGGKPGLDVLPPLRL